MPTTIAAPKTKTAPAAEKDFLPLQGTDYVEFYVGNDLRESDTSTPYEFKLDTLTEPDGDLKVSVDNRMLRKAGGRPAGYRVGGRPEGEGLQPLTGTYVPVPEKYASAETSGLTCHVERGGQTFDIRLE